VWQAGWLREWKRRKRYWQGQQHVTHVILEFLALYYSNTGLTYCNFHRKKRIYRNALCDCVCVLVLVYFSSLLIIISNEKLKRLELGSFSTFYFQISSHILLAVVGILQRNAQQHHS
jgi:hypothetical protein